MGHKSTPDPGAEPPPTIDKIILNLGRGPLARAPPRPPEKKGIQRAFLAFTILRGSLIGVAPLLMHQKLALSVQVQVPSKHFVY